jgi:hypothetical protein
MAQVVLDLEIAPSEIGFASMHAMKYNTCMEYQTMRVWKDTLKKLRHIYAATGESMIAIVDRLATQELERINHEDAEIQTVQQRKE